MDILSLPIEIIQLIGNDRNCVSLKTLRLVCSQFNRAYEAQVLSTLVIAVTNNTLKQSLDMLRAFASRNEDTSRAVQHARTLKIKYLSPITALDSKLLPNPRLDPESQDLSPSPPSLIRRLASAISSLKRRFKRTPTLKDTTSAIGEELMKKYLELAISSMKNLETVKWSVQICDPSWTGAAVIRGLTRLPQLQDLQLILYRVGGYSVGRNCIQLDLLSGLKKFSLSGIYLYHDIVSSLAGLIVRSPQLGHLEVKLDHFLPLETLCVWTLHDVLSKVLEDHPLQLTHLALNGTGICIDSFTLPHLRSLISLDLTNLPSPSHHLGYPTERAECARSTSDTCSILKQEGIYLKHLVVDDVGVFDYLCSYCGLETLNLFSMSFNSVEESNTSARTFYKSVLPHLVHSLQVLKIQPKEEGPWCFNPEDDFQSVALFQCNKLRSLSVALNSTTFVESINLYSRDWVLHQYKDNLDDAISSLINLSLSLPSMNEIFIVIPKLAFESDVVILSVMDMVKYYRKTVIGLVTRSITEFSLHVGHNPTTLLPDIWVDGKKLYQYQTLTALDDGERRRYMLSYDKPLDPYVFVEEEDFYPITMVNQVFIATNGEF